MITAQGIEVWAGAQLLLQPATFQIAKGDKIGLVGRNGAGKTTLTKILAGEGIPASGQVMRTGTVGYLPQDPRTGDVEQLARHRVISARGLDQIARRMRAAEENMASAD
ncbi:MAG: ATP-binding cassette domain-containing protein, partial [Propionibacteriaceae bacterium]